MMSAIIISFPSRHERWLAEEDAMEARDEAVRLAALRIMAAALAQVEDAQQNVALLSILGDCLARLTDLGTFATRFDALAEVEGMLAALLPGPCVIQHSALSDP